MKRIASVAVGAVLMLLSACNRAVPAGFWNSYRSDRIAFEASDQGPWGGDRCIRWESTTPGTFVEGDVQAFAVDHGWKLVDRIDYSASVPGNAHGTQVAVPSIVLKFETGWLRGNPEFEDLTPAFGYVEVSTDGKQMAVRHKWGSGG